jgi:hypothetical protein
VSAGKRKLVDEDLDDADEQTMKKVGKLLFIHKMTRGSRRSLVASPAFSNDSSELELPGPGGLGAPGQFVPFAN